MCDRRAINIPWVDPSAIYHVSGQLNPHELGIFTGEQLQAGDLTLSLR